MALLHAVVIGLVALALAPGWQWGFDVTPKLVILLMGTAIVLFGVRRAPRWFAILVLLYVLSLTISSALSGNPGLSFFGTNWRRFGAVPQAVVLLFALLLVGHAHRLRDILRVISFAAALTAIYGIAQYFHWDPILPSAAYQIGEGVWAIVRPPGTLGYVSYFATWLLITAFLSLALAALETRPELRRLALASAAIGITALLLTGTRAAMLGLAVGIGVWLWQRGFRITRRILLAAGAILVGAVVFYFSPAGQQMRSRTRWFIEDPWGGARIALWRDSLRMGVHRLPVGYGPEVFGASFPHWQSKELARAYPDFAHESPHNIFLDALIAQGIAGPLILAALCLAGFRAARQIGNPWLAAALAGGLVTQQFTVFTIPTALVFFVTIALAVGVATKPAPPVRRRILLAPVAIALVYCAVRFGIADHALALAKRSIEAGDARAAATHYDRYNRWRLPGASADLWYSRAMLDLAQKRPDIQTFIQAGVAATNATRTAEDPFNAWYSKAVFDAARNDAAGAESSLRTAISAHPTWFKPHWTLAQLLRLQARMPEAEREAAAAVDLDGGKHPEVSRILAEIRGQK